MGQLVTKSKFATLCKCSPAAITKAIKVGTLAAAVDGKRIDASHPDALGYMASRAKKLADAKNKPKPGTTAKSGKTVKLVVGDTERRGRKKKRPDPEDDEDIEYVMMLPKVPGLDVDQVRELTLEQVFNEFGTVGSLLDYLKAIKEIEYVEEKRNKKLKFRGDLVDRERAGKLFSIVNEIFTRLVDDLPTNLAGEIHTMLEGDPTTEEIEELIRSECSNFLKSGKRRLKTSLTLMIPKNARRR
ncbi:MAG: hypothetical protein KAJ19_07065 [Gammaproteobacteria bacterium]|nr:hypothetical protein [Gammaproteobacteria bacterium]